MRAPFLWLALALTAVSGCSGSSQSDAEPRSADQETLLSLSQGEIIGTRGRDNSYAWYGIPFAQAPVGALRWRAPRAPLGWEGRFEALDFSQRCTQLANDMEPGVEDGALVGDEDCLHLNVWAPPGIDLDQAAAQLPVMFWIHGGGNVWGYAGQYEMGRLAVTQNVVVVSTNYRLGPLGWFAHDAIRATADVPLDHSANFGTLDTIQALDWVASNIEAFGGDPDNITIFGESSGGVNVASLLVSPVAAGKFHKAIIQSGGFASHTLEEAEFGPPSPDLRRGYAAREAVEALGDTHDRSISSMSAEELANWLRARPAEEIFATYRDLQVEPPAFGGIDNIDITSDGVVIPIDGIEPALSDPSRHNETPLLLGTNRDEVKGIGFFDDTLMNNIWILSYWPKDRAFYEAYGEYPSRLWQAVGVQAPAQSIVANRQAPVFAYRFDWDEQGNAAFSDISFLIGAAHSIEIAFVTGGFDDPVNDPLSLYFKPDNREGREELSAAVMSYWAEFAYTGAPGRGRTGDLPEWTPWSNAANAQKLMVLDTTTSGGLRMTSNVTSVTALLAELEVDPRLENDAERCRVTQILRTLFVFAHEHIDPAARSYCGRPSD